jgi:hypothetical protein
MAPVWRRKNQARSLASRIVTKSCERQRIGVFSPQMRRDPTIAHNEPQPSCPQARRGQVAGRRQALGDRMGWPTAQWLFRANVGAASYVAT